MLISQIYRQLEKSRTLQPLLVKLDAGEDAGLEIPQSARPLIVASLFARRPRPMVVIVSGEDAAERFSHALGAYLGRAYVHRFPLRQDRPWSTEIPDPACVGIRMRALHALCTGEPALVVTSARALLRTVPPRGVDICSPIEVRCGHSLPDGIAYEDLAAALLHRGYVRLDGLDGPGTFSQKGDTIDIFPADSPFPVRLECFGDDVDALRRIVPTIGQTIGDLDEAAIYPCREVPLAPTAVKRAARLLEPLSRNDSDVSRHVELLEGMVPFAGMERYLPSLYAEAVSPLDHISDDTLVVAVEPRTLFDDTTRYYDEIHDGAAERHVDIEGLLLSPPALDFGTQQRLTLLSLLRVGGTVDARLDVSRPEVSGSEERLVATMRSLSLAKFTTILSLPERRSRDALELTLVENALPIHEQLESVHRDEAGISAETLPFSEPTAPLERGIVTIVDVDIPAGLIIPDAKLGIVSIADVSPRSARTSTRHAIDPTKLTFPYKPGDYVVHATHGIALFRQMARQEVGGIDRDYLQLEYAEGDKLFVPVEQIDRVTRYVGPNGDAPRLTRLNTSDWTRALGKARKAAKHLAFDLVDLYARRATVSGFSYGSDTPWQLEMEADFPYEETPDQLAAISDIKADMESDKPMDRLISGDVGFGKTEVALRAAFKAVQDHRQVMVLCPTTILAQQHFTTFSERMEPYGVSVEVLSRFRTPAQLEHALVGFATGTVDILVGTHRLLSRDVNPKDLGLIVVDEEQRFGVQHKEQLKTLREQVDVLSLSATPIPRTLRMALSGVRDMSLISTPPGKRMPVGVQVGEWDPDVVSSAIRFEIARGGQVYYVSNRVKSIDDAVSRVLEAAPEARIGVAHGQMDSHTIEAVMEAFAAGETDVLVATTIIESGLDNPHTNTLIIEDAHRLGLAQLYQLKGRVGRSRTQAFAYFMFPSKVQLTEQAVDRLTAIAEHQELGSGMKIAMRDLEIRGAGSLFGAEQHGNLNAVGFDLFAQMLQEAVAGARGEHVSVYADIKVDLPVQYFLPEEYVEAADERVLYYRRIAGASSLEALDAVADDLRSRYGALPVPAENLLDRSRVKALAAELDVTSVSLVGGKLVIQPIDPPKDATIQADTSGRAATQVFRGVLRQGGSYVPARKRLQQPVGHGESGLVVALDLLKRLVALHRSMVDPDTGVSVDVFHALVEDEAGQATIKGKGEVHVDGPAPSPGLVQGGTGATMNHVVRQRTGRGAERFQRMHAASGTRRLPSSSAAEENVRGRSQGVAPASKGVHPTRGGIGEEVTGEADILSPESRRPVTGDWTHRPDLGTRNVIRHSGGRHRNSR